MPSLSNLVKIGLQNPSASAWAIFHQLRHLTNIEPKFLKGYSLYPDFITFTITKRCNYRCAHCSAHSSTASHQAKQELTFKDYQQIIDQVKKFKPAIYFCGGEPTLRPDLIDIINYCKKNKLICALTTNASLITPAYAQKLVNSKIDFISISLDGNQIDHDQGRGVPGAYQQVIKAVKLLKKFRSNRWTPHIKLVGIIHPEHPQSALHVLKIGNRLKVDEIAFGHIMFYPKNVFADQAKFIHQFKIGSDYITGMLITKNFQAKTKQIQKVVQKIKNNKPVHTYIAQGFNLDIDKYYQTPYQYPGYNSDCKTPWFSAIIQPNGDVSPCMEFKIGNIKQQNFLKLYNHPKWKLFRRLKANKTKVPACFRCAEGQKIKFS